MNTVNIGQSNKSGMLGRLRDMLGMFKRKPYSLRVGKVMHFQKIIKMFPYPITINNLRILDIKQIIPEG